MPSGPFDPSRFDEVIVARAVAGDPDCRRGLFRELQPRLLRFLRSQESRAADDLAAEVWLAVAGGIGRFEGDWADFRAWIFAIARKRLADHRRTALRRRTDTVDVEGFDRTTSPTTRTENEALDKISGGRAAAMITAVLSADQAEVLLLEGARRSRCRPGGRYRPAFAELGQGDAAQSDDKPHQTSRTKDCCNAMSDWDDLEPVTPRISSQDAERLLSGTSDVDETDELADVSAVLGALRRSAEPDELSGLDSVLAAFGAAVVTAQALPSTLRTFPMTKKRLTRKSLAAIVGITLVSAGAAAASGVVSTPFSAQRPSVASSMHFAPKDSTDETDADETTPASDEVDSDDATETDCRRCRRRRRRHRAADDATVGTDGQGPDVNGPAKFGLRTAYAARTKHDEVTDTTAAATPRQNRRLSTACRCPSRT